MSLVAGGDTTIAAVTSVLVGRAGTGKTHTLGTIRMLYEDAGFTVVGLAQSARAARELEAGAGILVGDHHQLPEVAGGGGFRAALDVLDDRVAELTVNRRQHATWEQAALDQLRHGDVTAAFAAYQAHGRVVLDDDRHTLRQRAIADWNTLRTDGVTLMLAGTRTEARQLNLLARQTLADAGELDLERAVTIGERSYAPSEHVTLRRNHRGQHLASS